MTDFLDEMYEEAFVPFRVDTGTPYPSNQKQLDYHWESFFEYRNKGPFVSSNRATEDMLKHNDLDRRISSAEGATITRLQTLIVDVQRGGYWGPDVAVKAFEDLDLVFFGGHLHGHVCVCWDDLADHILGWTEFPTDSKKHENQCHIVLNAQLIFGEADFHPFVQMVHTLLHEMVHALDTVRCPHTYDGSDGHDRHFETRISTVDKSAKAFLGVAVIDPLESYKQCHFIRKSKVPGFCWSPSHVRDTRDGRSRKSKRDSRRGDRRGYRRDSDSKACIVM